MFILMAAATLCLGFGLGAIYETLNKFIELPHSQTLEPLNKMMSELRNGPLVAAVLIIGFLPAICEELLCRGYIQTRLRQRWGIWPAILITSILFAILHMDLVQGILVLFLGLYLGYVTEKSGSIRPSMICHAANTAAATLMAAGVSYFAGPIAATQPAVGDVKSSLFFIASLATGFVLINLWLRHLFQKHPGLPLPAYIPPPDYTYPPEGYHFQVQPPPLPTQPPLNSGPPDDPANVQTQ